MSLKKDEKGSSLRDVYGEKLGSFLEAKEECYNNWKYTDNPEYMWYSLQLEKEKFLGKLVSSGLKFSEEIRKEIDWRDMLELLIKNELIDEYPISLAYNTDSLRLLNNFSPKWGINTGRLDRRQTMGIKNAIGKKRIGEKLDYSFEMNEIQWRYFGYEVILLCKDFIRINMGEISLQLTRLEESKIRRDYEEELQKNNTVKRGISSQNRFILEDKLDLSINSLTTTTNPTSERAQGLHSKLTKDYNNLKAIYSSISMFSEIVRLRYGIDSSTDYLINRLLSKNDYAGMGFFSNEDIHPLDTRYRVLLLMESWNKADTVICESTTWDNGKLRIKPGGAPRIIPEITNSKSFMDEIEFKNWVNRQIYFIYFNIAFKLQRILMFMPPGWLHYLPGDIDLKNMMDHRKNSWYNNNNIRFGNQVEFMLEGIRKYLGKNPQILFEYILESITILNNLRINFERGIWGDLCFLKVNNNEINGKTKLIRLLKLMSAMERLDLAIRRDLSDNSLKNISSTFMININSYCINLNNNKEKRFINNKVDDSIYSLNNNNTSFIENQNYNNKRQYIYNNDYIKESIEERLLILPKLSSYWMYDSQIIHTIINCLMTVNLTPFNLNNQIIDSVKLLGLHLYCPLITKCILFIGYMLENGIYDSDYNINNKISITTTGIIPTSIETYSLYLISNIWKCYDNYLLFKNSNSNINREIDKFSESENDILDIFFSIINLILTDFRNFLRYSTIDNLVKELRNPTEEFKKIELNKEITKPTILNMKSRLHTNSRELLRKITNKEVKNNLDDKIIKDIKDEEEYDDDLINIDKFCKINNFINFETKYWNLLSQPIIKYNEKLWYNPDWIISIQENNNKVNDKNYTQFWRVFGISLTTCSRFERIYNDILLRRMNTLVFRSKILKLCQNFFQLNNPKIFKKLLLIIKKINILILLENETQENKISSTNLFESDKRLWVRYCNYCILRSNELKIRELFQLPMQMLRLPATHYVELKLRLKSKDLDNNEEKIRMEKLARQEIQGCMETFINSFKYLEEIYIPETITNWSKVMFEGANLAIKNNNFNLIKDYALIIVRLLEVYIPYFLEQLMNSEYWDLLMIPKIQFDDLIKSIIAIDKYMIILRNWLEFNLDSIKIQGKIIDSLMIFNQSHLIDQNIQHEVNQDLKIQEMMRKRYLNDIQLVTLINLFIPQFILLIQNRINNIEFLVYQVYYYNKESNSNEWIHGINIPNIYTSSVIIDISTIVNTGIESLIEWMNFPIEDEQSLILSLSPIMKFYRDITNFIVNTIKKELSCQKYELMFIYTNYIIDILLVLFKNNSGINGNNINSNTSHELKSLIKLHNISKLIHNFHSINSNSNIQYVNNMQIMEEYSSELLLTDKFDKNNIFYNLLSICLKDDNSDLSDMKNNSINDKEDINNYKYLVSIHNLCFFKNVILETSQKFISLFFQQSCNNSLQNNEISIENQKNQDMLLSKYNSGNINDNITNQTTEFKLSNQVLGQIKKILEFLRNYGAMDNEENKLLASENYFELNSLLFSQNNSISKNYQVLLHHKELFFNLINDCVKNIDKLIIYIFNMYSTKTLTNTFGIEFFLRIYNNTSYSSIDDDINITIETLLPTLNNHFQQFIKQCPFDRDEYNETIYYYKEIKNTNNELKEEFNKIYINSITLLWLTHIFELSLNKNFKLMQDMVPLFEYDFELLDELRRSFSIVDCINKNQNYRLSDVILYFITQLLNNKKLTQNRIFKDLTLITSFGIDDNRNIDSNDINNNYNNQNNQNNNHQKKIEKNKNSLSKNLSDNFDYSVFSIKNLSKSSQIMSKIIKNSTSSQKKIRNFISKNIYS